MANRIEEMRKERQERSEEKTTLRGAFREFIRAFAYENGGYDEERVEAEVAAIRAKQESFKEENIEQKVKVNDEPSRGYSRSRVMKATKGKPTRKREENDRDDREER